MDAPPQKHLEHLSAPVPAPVVVASASKRRKVRAAADAPAPVAAVAESDAAPLAAPSDAAAGAPARTSEPMVPIGAPVARERRRYGRSEFTHAVDHLGILGCSKCRYQPHGCSVCRKKREWCLNASGIWEPQSAGM